jgi:hypothetical protein
MCLHHWNCAPPVPALPAYTPSLPAHFHYHLVETITITIQLEVDVTT